MAKERRGGAVALAITVVGALLLAAAGLVRRTESASALTNCAIADYSLDSEEQAFLGMINAYRAQNGLGALVLSTNLNRAAAWMSNDMGVTARFSHTDSLGRSPSTRSVDCGYPSGAGENIAAGTAWSSAQSVMDAWKASSGHNANMLTSYYLQIGIARANIPGSPYGWYWTTNFGAVNDGTGGSPAATNTPTVAPATNTPMGATATATRTNTPAPTSTAPAPTNTPAPTSTALAPTSTPTRTSTVTPPPNTPTPTNTPLPQPTPTGTATPTSATPTSTPVTPLPSTASPATASATPTTAPIATATPVRTAVPESGATGTSLPLSTGANLVAWPSGDVEPAKGLGASSGNIIMVYAWDGTTGTWKRYGPSLPGFMNNLTMLRQGGAYWVVARTGGVVPLGK